MLKQFNLRPDDVTNGTWWLKEINQNSLSKREIKREESMSGAYVRMTFVAANDSLIHVRRTDDNDNFFAVTFATALEAKSTDRLHFTDRRSILYAVCSFTILYLVKMGFRIFGFTTLAVGLTA